MYQNCNSDARDEFDDGFERKDKQQLNDLLARELDQINLSSMGFLEALIAAGADVNTQGWNTKYSLAHYGAARADANFLQLIKNKGGRFDLKSTAGITPLFNTKHIDTIKFLMEEGADPFHTVQGQYFFNMGDTAIANYLLQHIINESPPNLMVISHLLKCGAHPTETQGKALLTLAITLNNADIIRGLYKKIDFNSITPSPLLSANDKETAVALLKGGALLSEDALSLLVTIPGISPDLLLFFSSTVNEALTLIEKGASLWARNEANETAIFYLSRRFDNDRFMLDSLLKKEMDKTQWDPNLLSELIALGANPNVQNVYGNSVAHLAVYTKNTSLINLLIQKGADLNLSSNNYHTPLLSTQNTDLQNLLVQGGADPSSNIAYLKKEYGTFCLTNFLTFELNRHEYARFHVIESLFKAGADVNTQSTKKPDFNVFCAVAQAGRADVINYFYTFLKVNGTTSSQIDQYFLRALDYSKPNDKATAGFMLEKLFLNRTVFDESLFSIAKKFPSLLEDWLARELDQGQTANIGFIKELLFNCNVNVNTVSPIHRWNASHMMVFRNEHDSLTKLIDLNVDIFHLDSQNRCCIDLIRDNYDTRNYLKEKFISYLLRYISDLQERNVLLLDPGSKTVFTNMIDVILKSVNYYQTPVYAIYLVIQNDLVQLMQRFINRTYGGSRFCYDLNQRITEEGEPSGYLIEYAKSKEMVSILYSASSLLLKPRRQGGGSIFSYLKRKNLIDPQAILNTSQNEGTSRLSDKKYEKILLNMIEAENSEKYGISNIINLG